MASHRSSAPIGLLAAIKRDLIAQDRFAIGHGWAPEGGGWGAWWWRYRRNHHAAGIMILHRLREWARRRPSAFLPGLCDRLNEILHHTAIGRDVKLGVGVYFPHGWAHIHGDTTIGDCVIVGVHSGIGLRGSFFSNDMGTKGPTIGAYTRVGTGAKVLGNVTVGERAVIGAGAVVIRDVPEAATVVGVPARVVRQGPVGDELPAALERLEALRRTAAERRNEQAN
jgi:serine O-acetyltransferase